MLDISTETLISLGEATRLIPPARSGRKTHLSTIIRWMTRGATAPDGSRVRLAGVRLGDRWLTSREALQRFAEALTPRPDGEAPAAPAPRTPTRRRTASERAATELERMGI